LHIDDTVVELTNGGTYITTIDFYDFKISLYAMDSEFYEITYCPTDNKIWKVIQVGKDDLEKYISRIELIDLIKFE